MTNKNIKSTIASQKPVLIMDPKSDIVFKKIFGQHPHLIKSFLNGILPFPEDRLIKTIEYLTPEQSPRIPSLKNTIVDVKCTDQENRIFIVEMQMQWHMHFDKRFLYNTSKAFVQQLDKSDAYSELYPVYGVAIVNEVYDKQTTDWFHHYRLAHAKDPKKTLEGIELLVLELPKFIPQTRDHRKMGLLWMRFLKEMNAGSIIIPQEFQDDPDLALAVELSQESAYTKEELEAYDAYLDAIRVEKTVRVGSYTTGKTEGIAEGIEKGKEETTLELAKIMLSEEMSPETVSRITKLSIEIVKNLELKIKKS